MPVICGRKRRNYAVPLKSPGEESVARICHLQLGTPVFFRCVQGWMDTGTEFCNPCLAISQLVCGGLYRQDYEPEEKSSPKAPVNKG